MACKRPVMVYNNHPAASEQLQRQIVGQFDRHRRVAPPQRVEQLLAVGGERRTPCQPPVMKAPLRVHLQQPTDLDHLQVPPAEEEPKFHPSTYKDKRLPNRPKLKISR